MPKYVSLLHCLTIIIVYLQSTCGHPQCLDFKPPFNSSDAANFEICNEYQNFGCCDSNRAQQLAEKYRTLRGNLTDVESSACDTYLKQLICQECSPFSAHIYNVENSQTVSTSFPGLCKSYCEEFMQGSCGRIVSLITDDATLIALQLSKNVVDFCQAVKTSDIDYCFPELQDNSDLNMNLGTVDYYNVNSTCDRFCVKEMASGMYNPLTLKHAKDGSHRIFIGEQRGFVYVFDHQFNRRQEPFLDLSESVVANSLRYDERGFLDIEFHPNHAENGKFYICYSFINSNGSHAVTINEMQIMTDDKNRANVTTERQLIEIVQPAQNHNGGQLLFGDDGYLYIFTGDGGGKGDPWGKVGNGQKKNTLLGKVLRINVDVFNEEFPYGIPVDNPFIQDSDYRSEIYALGVRNMWRCSKDRGDDSGTGKGRIICGDVGQDKFEEIDLIEKGANYGWRAFEGNSCHDETLCNINPDQYTAPIYSYPHSDGKSVTGGYVYRGCENPNLRGKYIFGDFYLGRMFSLQEGSDRWSRRSMCVGDNTICKNDGLLSSYSKYILSFGEDEAGELYFLSTSNPLPEFRGGSVYKIVDPSKRGNPTKCKLPIPMSTISPTTPGEATRVGPFMWFMLLPLIALPLQH